MLFSQGYLEALSLLFIGYLFVLSIVVWVMHFVKRLRRSDSRRTLRATTSFTNVRVPSLRDEQEQRRRDRHELISTKIVGRGR